MLDLEALDFNKGDGFVTVVCQDAQTQGVLMVARADREALERTLATGEMHYHSRSRGLWHKGATSGNVQRVVSLHVDCDGDAVLARVTPAGPACHTGAVSCFFQEAGAAEESAGASSFEASSGGPPPDSIIAFAPTTPLHHSTPSPTNSSPDTVLSALAATIAERAAALPLPEGVKPSYTQRLLSDRNLRLKKLGEEAVELAVACVDEDRARAVEEGGDVIYHTLVALAALGISLEDVAQILARRAR